MAMELSKTSWSQRRRVGRGCDIQPRFEESEVVTFSRPEHHAVLSQSDRLRVTIHREVTDSEGHMKVHSQDGE